MFYALKNNKQILKIKTIKNVDKDVKTWNAKGTAHENIKCCCHFGKTVWQLLKILMNYDSDPATHILEYTLPNKK